MSPKPITEIDPRHVAEVWNPWYAGIETYLSKYSKRTRAAVRAQMKGGMSSLVRAKDLQARRQFLSVPEQGAAWAAICQSAAEVLGPTCPGAIFDFDAAWMRAGFPVVQLSEPIRAELACTEIREDALDLIRAPWPAWCITSDFDRSDLICVRARRVADRDTLQASHYRDSDGMVINSQIRTLEAFLCGDVVTWDDESARQAEVNRRVIGNLCIAITNGAIALKKLGPRLARDGRPAQPERLKAQADVKVDLTPIIKAYLAGETEASWKLRVRSFVRGFWRRPPRTAAEAQKTIWVRPHWRGPHDADVAVRKHVIV